MLFPRRIWKDIQGYEGLYQVSNLGEVRSLNYKKTGNIQNLKQTSNKDGYLKVMLHKNGKIKTYQVHRLVTLAFIENPNKYPCINHKDEDKTNNCVWNLEWCNYKYNNCYGTRIKRFSESRKGKCSGKSNPKAKKVQCINTGKIFNTIKEAGEYYYIDKSCISKYLNGRIKYAGKHPVTGEKLYWKFIDNKEVI